MSNRWHNHLNALRDGTLPLPPSAENLKLGRLDAWEPGRIEKTWVFQEDFRNRRGALFGGYLASLADQAAALAAFSVLEDSESFTTADLQISFFRPALDGPLKIVAMVVNRSRSLLHVEVEISGPDGRLVAKSRVVQAVRPYVADG